jgi:hypothetical protein
MATKTSGFIIFTVTTIVFRYIPKVALGSYGYNSVEVQLTSINWDPKTGQIIRMSTVEHITALINELSHEHQLQVWKNLRKKLLPPEECPDYIIYDVGHAQTLCNDEMMDILWEEMNVVGLRSELLYVVQDAHTYFNVYRDSQTGSFGEHPEARKIMSAMKVKPPVNGIMVKHDVLKPPYCFVEAVMECARYGRLTSEPHTVSHADITVDGVRQTVVRLQY